MQSWIRDLIDLKTEKLRSQFCRIACSSQPAAMQRQPATTGLQIRVNRGRGAALLSIQPLPGHVTGRRYSGGCLRSTGARSAGQAAARSIGAPPPESTHFCTNVPLDSVAYCLLVAGAGAKRFSRIPAGAAAELLNPVAFSLLFNTAHERTVQGSRA
jgi:hypothetical protein